MVKSNSQQLAADTANGNNSACLMVLYFGNPGSACTSAVAARSSSESSNVNINRGCRDGCFVYFCHCETLWHSVTDGLQSTNSLKLRGSGQGTYMPFVGQGDVCPFLMVHINHPRPFVVSLSDASLPLQLIRTQPPYTEVLLLACCFSLCSFFPSPSSSHRL